MTITFSGVTLQDRSVCKTTIVMECGLTSLRFDRCVNKKKNLRPLCMKEVVSLLIFFYSVVQGKIASTSSGGLPLTLAE